MTDWIDTVALWTAIAVALVLVAAWHGAQFWADYLKSMRLRPEGLPAFWRMGRDWDISPIGNFYSDLHRDYDSRFITGCVWTFRTALPALGLVLLIAFAARLVH
ncbi:hypothetical protein [Brevundimonas sp.]|uniref:hypothetical protein n=1 Tax=Brevundimonas sp. TaxID=1871086 RepID=UPI002C838FDD|nr:hypothetical protein [Brevundimonas sp.]HWQ85958.1 hypothetical protein [Brevundimonas sp.]